MGYDDWFGPVEVDVDSLANAGTNIYTLSNETVAAARDVLDKFKELDDLQWTGADKKALDKRLEADIDALRYLVDVLDKVAYEFRSVANSYRNEDAHIKAWLATKEA